MTPNLDPHNVRTQIETLKVRFPEIWAEGDDQLLQDCLEAETSVHEFLRAIEDRRQEAVSMSAALATRIAELGNRQERYEQREQAMRHLALSIMQAAEMQKCELPEATYSVRKGTPRIVVINEDAVPEELCRVTVTRKPDKEKIKEALNGGELPNWAVREGGTPGLSIRVK